MYVFAKSQTNKPTKLHDSTKINDKIINHENYKTLLKMKGRQLRL